MHKHKREDNTEIDLRGKEGCGMELFISGSEEDLGCYRKFTKPKSPTEVVIVQL